MKFIARHFPVLQHRCAHLFFALVSWLVISSFLSHSIYNEIIDGLLNLAIMLAAVAAVSNSRRSLLVSMLSGVTLAALWYISLTTPGQGDDAFAWAGTVVFYLYVLTHLMRYVMKAEVVTADKLYGAAAVYIMLAFVWAGLYGVVQYFYPAGFADSGTVKILTRPDLVYFSFSTLTTAGYGDITPMLPQVRVLAMLEACAGVLFTAILIARLASEYPSVGTEASDSNQESPKK